MLKTLCFVSLLFFTKAAESEDNCVIAYLKQRNSLSENAFADFPARLLKKNCDSTVKKIVKRLFDENFDYLDKDAKVDNKTYRACLTNEFERLRLDLKFLKATAFENDPIGVKLGDIRDNFIRTIKLNCSKVLEKDASLRFKSFISDVGGLSPKMEKHPAIKKIKANLVCLNQYAVERQILDPSELKLKLSPVKLSDKDCVRVLSQVKTLITDEWHIRVYSENDAINRCFINVLLQTQAIDVFIKNALLSQLQLTQYQKKLEHDNFLKTSNIVHELAYKCMSMGFEEV